MAFETFLTVDQQKPKKGRRATFVVSLAVHGVLLAVGVAASYGSVEELSPKNGVAVTWLNLPTPPPPAAASKKRTSPQTKPRPTEHVQPRVSSLVAPPKETVKDDTDGDDDKGDPNGKIGGDRNGIPGGEIGGHETPTHYLPPNVAKGQLAIDPQAEQHRARLPPALMHAGMSVWALMRVCVDRDGNVVEVKIIKGVDATVDASFVSAVRTWRYTPFRVDGRPVPFCTNVRYEMAAR
jgi:outer membrane biosynthesis protein TonB